MKDRSKRLNEVFQYLRYKGKVSTQKSFAESIGADKSNMSSALKGMEKYLTDGLLKRIVDVYPEINRIWLMTGNGSMLKSENTEVPACEIEQPNLTFTNMDLQRLLSAIEQHGEELKKQGERLDRILDLVASSNQSRVG